jgi:hypothetical protein
LSIQSSKEWRFLTNRGDLIGGNQGDLIIRNNTDGINHIILNQGGATTFAGALSGTSGTFTSTLTTPFLSVTQSGGQIGNFNSTNANGGYLTWTTSGTTIADIGTAQQIFGSGGADTFGINARGARSLVFGTNNTARFTLSSTGDATFTSNVISRSYSIREASAPRGGLYPYNIISGAGTDYSIGLFSESSMWFAAGGGITKHLNITSAGNVGIGTTAPGAKLDIAGGDLYVRTGGAIYANTYSTYSGNMSISLGGSGNNLIVSGGNVGIGTTPSSNWGSRSVLQLGGFGTSLSGFNGGGGATNLMHNAIANAFSYTYLINGGATNQYMDGNDIVWANAPVGTAGNAITFTERLRIDGSGNLIFTGQSSSKIQFYNAYSGSPANVGLALFNTSGTTVIALNSNGGGAYFASLGTGLVYSSGGSLTSTNPSDSRLKKNIQNISYGLADIMKLRPVSYNWETDNINQGIQFGFIAQEVKEIMPDAIKEFGEETKFLGLEKDAIYATLVNAIKELKTELDTLKNK